MRGFLLALFSTCLFLAPTVIAISMSSHPLQRSGDAYGRRLAFITKERPSIRVFGIRELWARSHLEWDDDGKACFEALQAEGDTGPDWNHTWSERDARAARRYGACPKIFKDNMALLDSKHQHQCRGCYDPTRTPQYKFPTTTWKEMWQLFKKPDPAVRNKEWGEEVPAPSEA
jgi:hypothetical protein